MRPSPWILRIDPGEITELYDSVASHWAKAIPRNRLLRAATLLGLAALRDDPSLLGPAIDQLVTHKTGPKQS